MKQFSLILAVILLGCGRGRQKLEGFSSRTDTIAVAYVQNGVYNFARAARIISRQPKITDSSSKKWDWAIDTSYVVEVPIIPLDTLRDSLHRPRFDANHIPILHKSFTAVVHTPLPSYFWVLLPNK